MAEEVAAVAVAKLARFFGQIKCLGRRGAHEANGAVVGGFVARGGNARVLGDEVLLKTFQELDASVKPFLFDLTGRFEILDAKHFVEIAHGAIRGRGGLVADDQRGVLGPQKAGGKGGGAGGQDGGNAHKAGQRRLGVAEFFRQERSQGRELNRALGPIAGPQVVGGPGVIAFPAAHRAHQARCAWPVWPNSADAR